MSADAPLAGRTALVTGAGRGIGRAVARGYARAGAFVYGLARSEGEPRRAVGEIVAAGGEAGALVADVTDADALAASYRRVAEERGSLDLLVVNAGVDLERAPVETSDPERFARTVEVNLLGAYHTVRLAIPLMKARGGKIVTIGSGTGRDGKHGVAVNERIPSPVDTAMSADGDGSLRARGDEWSKGPDEVVPLALFLATQPEPGPSGQSFSLMRRV